jgi:mannosyl-3-phosphoglycerate phosphatase
MPRLRGLLLTDLDGTLLDHHTYRPSPRAVSIIAEFARAGVSTIPVTSKTAAEVVELLPELRCSPWAVVEGGGAVVRPDGRVEPTDARGRDLLIDALAAVAADGFEVRGAHQMDPEEFASRTGLSLDRASRALDRHASEPFVFVGGDSQQGAMVSALRNRGVSVTRGGRFWHLQHSGVTKAVGAEKVLRLLGAPSGTPTAAVGDAWNDLPLLDWVDHGFLLGDVVAPEDVPAGVHRIATFGPAGFERAGEHFASLLGLGLFGKPEESPAG